MPLAGSGSEGFAQTSLRNVPSACGGGNTGTYLKRTECHVAQPSLKLGGCPWHRTADLLKCWDYWHTLPTRLQTGSVEEAHSLLPGFYGEQLDYLCLISKTSTVFLIQVLGSVITCLLCHWGSSQIKVIDTQTQSFSSWKLHRDPLSFGSWCT